MTTYLKRIGLAAIDDVQHHIDVEVSALQSLTETSSLSNHHLQRLGPD